MKILDKKNIEFTEVYSNYFPVVSGTIYTKIGSRQSAEDLAQDVFIRFLNNMEEVDNCRAWLFGTMKNVLLDYYRKKMKMSEEQAMHEVMDDISLTFINGFRDTRIIINEAIEYITDEIDRIIFDLIAIQNYTYEETGKHLGFNKRQVRYKYGLIVQKIRDFLEKRGIKDIESLL